MAPRPAGAERPDGIGRYWGLVRSIVGPPLRFLVRVHLQGTEHVPASGPAIIAPNHIAFVDSTLLLFCLPRRITFVGKAEYMDSWKTRHLFPAVGMIPIDRSGGESSTAALDAAAEILSRGELFAIYPEGTRSRDGRLHRGHTGVARLALRTGAPIVPTGIVGTQHIQPPGSPVIKPFMPATIRFGPAVDPAPYAAREDEGRACRELTDAVMSAIRSLTGQAYVDRYASPSGPIADAAPEAAASLADHEPAGV